MLTFLNCRLADIESAPTFANSSAWLSRDLSEEEKVFLLMVENDDLKVRSYNGVTIGKEHFAVAHKGLDGVWHPQQGSSHLKAVFSQKFCKKNSPQTVYTRTTVRYGVLMDVLKVGCDGKVLLDVKWYKQEAGLVNTPTQNVHLKLIFGFDDPSTPRLVEASRIANLVVIQPLPYGVILPGTGRTSRRAVVFDRQFTFGTKLISIAKD